MNTKSGSPNQGDTGYCGFVVGQHVVCVDTIPENNTKVIQILGRGGTAHLPELNRVYTVRAIYTNPVTGRVSMRLKELVNMPLPSIAGMWEPGFPVTMFRPLQS
jgi:phosphoribosylcarboxyaminoimidazole (NCAIR) mutase